MNLIKVVKRGLVTLLVIGVVVGVNAGFYQFITTSSQSLENDAVTVNLASRQSTLVQQMAKTLFQLEERHERNRSIASLLAELSSAYKTIEQTLTGLSEGGVVTALDGREFSLSKAPTANTARLVEQARRIWNPYAKDIERLLQIGDEASETDIKRALRSASGKTNPLTAITTKISVELEIWAKEKADGQQQIIVYTAVAIINILFLVAFLAYTTLRRGAQLSKTAKQLGEAKTQTDSILDTIEEGLVLVDRTSKIGMVQSKETGLLLRESELNGKSLLDLLKPKIPVNQFSTAEEYIDLMFQKRVKERLIADLNPLSEVEINFQNADGTFDTYYYSFKFNRIFEGGEVTQLLVTISDVTKSVLLSQQLKKIEEDAAEQVGLVFNIIHVQPRELDGFINRMKQSLDDINGALKKDRGLGSHLETLNEIFRIAHQIKGDAAVLGLDLFEKKLHQFETTISDLKRLPDLSGNDFLRLTVTLDGLFDTVEDVKQLIGRLAGIQGQFDGAGVDHFQQGIEALCQRVSRRQGKNVVINWDQFDGAKIPAQQYDVLKSIVVQLVRNSIVHGIEGDAEREALGKPSTAKICIKTEVDEKSQLHLSVEDDGRGLQIDRIKQQARVSGHWNDSEIDSWDEKKAVAAVFTSGFSTVTEVDEDAGRGMGMDVIKNEISKLRGKLGIATKNNEFCRFKLITPTV